MSGPSKKALEWFHAKKRDFGLPRGGMLEDFADNIVRALDAYAAETVAQAVASEREAIIAWFEAKRMTFTAKEVRECLSARQRCYAGTVALQNKALRT